MNETETNNDEALVLQRYKELAGLVRGGQMVNKDKEHRAREYVRERKKYIEQVLKENSIRDNATYGKFILQTNKVQYYLAKLIFLRSFEPHKSFEKYLERLQLGQLISYMNICARTKLDMDLLSKLTNYKDRRDALAHKMFTSKKLTVSECEQAIKQGDIIIKYLIEALQNTQKIMIKGTDKISDFPNQFNKLVQLVESPEKRVRELEQEKKTKKKQSSKS
jgi:hypothetical protein